jgi:hypothetical protein
MTQKAGLRRSKGNKALRSAAIVSRALLYKCAPTQDGNGGCGIIRL